MTLEVARNAAAYYGLANLLNQPSPQVARHPRIMSHSHSQSFAGQHPAAQPQPPPQHFLSQAYLSSQAAPMPQLHTGQTLAQAQQQPSYANAPPVSSAGVPAPHLMPGASSQAMLLQSQSSLVPEERHYQNISMYRQPQPPLPHANGIASNGSVRALNNSYPHPSHHNSYSSLHALSSAGAGGSQLAQQQLNSATLPHGRPMSTVFPNMMGHRAASMAQYPTYAGPGSQLQMQAQQMPHMYRSGHAGSVPALHGQWGRDAVPYAGPPAFGQPVNGPGHMGQQYGRSAASLATGLMLPPPSRVSIVSTKGLIDGEQPPTGYRYVPSAYPTKSMDSLNNNTMMMNGHNNNNNSMKQQQQQQQLWRRNANNGSTQEFNSAQIEEQEERLRLLKLEEMKRLHELEVAQIQIAEDRLLNEAKSRRGQVSSRSRLRQRLQLAACT